MKLFGKLITFIIGNAVALFAASRFIPGFVLEPGIKNFVSALLLLTAANLIIRPIAKLFLGPLIIITLGIFTIIINAAILYTIDIYSPSITISGLGTLITATIVMSVINFLIYISFRPRNNS